MIEENRQVDSKPRKRHTGLIVCIMLIAGLLIGIGGSYYYLEMSKSTNTGIEKEEKQEKEKAENLDVLDSTVLDNFTKMIKAIARCDDLASEYFKPSKVTVSNLNKELVYSVVDINFLNQQKSVSAAEYESKVKEYFGADYKYEHEDFSQTMCTSHKYNKDTNSYEYVQTACGCTTGPNSHILYRISKAELLGDEMELTIKVLFPGGLSNLDNEGHVKYYSDVNTTKEIPDLMYHSSENPNDAQVIDNDDAYKKGGTYKFIMKKYKDDIYAFVSAEPID